ncbi:MAG: glycogen synthase GlgA [Tissierellia bacterium]|nr:glycogen synthase GlgA [Tissierellia bacterium]
MKVLFVTSESVPYIKTGGLADVSGALPSTLGKKGVEMARVLPLYRQVEEKYGKELDYIGYFYVDIGVSRQYAGIFQKKEEHLTTYFIDSKRYFDREQLYGEPDDGERFFFFNKAVTQFIKEMDLKVDLVHCNDWHTGFIPLYIKDFAKGDPYYKDIKTLFTIHNIKYQGVFPRECLTFIGGLSPKYFHEEGVQYYDGINFMKAGIVYGDQVSTVSKNYAKELQYSYYGEGLEGLLKKYQNKFTGILNGLDMEIYNPKIDPSIPFNFDKNSLEKKKKNKKILQKKMGLPQKDVPLLSVVSRLVEPKGMDLLLHIGDELLQEEIQLVVLGTGEKKYEDRFREMERHYPKKMSAGIYFSEEDAHLVYGGADYLLMPSLSEPCGLSQMNAQAYGTIPIVRETGGLVDTVKPYNKYTKMGSGISFGPINAHEFLFAIKRGLEIYGTKEFDHLRIQCMEQDNSWESAGNEYKKLYQSILQGKTVGAFEEI